MEKELLAALAGGVVGVLGSLLSVAIGYYLQTKFALKQSEQQRALHQEQIDNERATLDGDVSEIAVFEQASY